MCSLDFSAPERHTLWLRRDIAPPPRELFGKISPGEAANMSWAALLLLWLQRIVRVQLLSLWRFTHSWSLVALLWAQKRCPCRTPGMHPHISSPACLATFTSIYCLNKMVIIFYLLPSLFFFPHLCFRKYLGPFAFHLQRKCTLVY